MFDYQDYYTKLHKEIEKGNALWQAIVVATDGSTPAKPGMHLAVSLNQKPLGNLGGGNLEHYVIDYICEMQPQNVVTLKCNLNDAGKPMERVKAERNGAVNTGMICGGFAEIMIEPLFSTHTLFIIGGGHCGKALAHLATLTGFKVQVIDNRKEQLDPELFPKGCTLAYNDFANIAATIAFSKNAFIVIMTHGHIHDKQVLQQCLQRKTRYLGMIGSSRKVKETFDKLLAEGYTAEDLNRVHAPVGIPIGSQTPYEIAVSITAELIKERSTDKQ